MSAVDIRTYAKELTARASNAASEAQQNAVALQEAEAEIDILRAMCDDLLRKNAVLELKLRNK